MSMFVLPGAIPLLYSLFKAKTRLRRVGALLLLIFVMLGAFILASRGAVVAFVIAAAAMLYAMGRSTMRAIAYGLAICLVFAIALFLPGGDQILARAADTALATANGRLDIWRISLRHFDESSPAIMLIGNGFGSANSILHRALTDDQWNYHDEYLLRVMDHGIFGLAAFLLFLWAVKRRIVNVVAFGWLVFLLVSCLSGTNADTHSFWILLGAAIVAPRSAAVSQLSKTGLPASPRPALSLGFQSYPLPPS